MNLGIDCDGCVANIDQELIHRLGVKGIESDINNWHNYYLEKNHPEVPIEWINEQFADPTLWINAVPYEDAWHMVNKWFGEGHNVFIITARPKDVWELTYKWFDNWYIGCNDVYCVPKMDKHLYIDKLNLDLFIEDDPITAAEISLGITSFLIDRPYNRRYDIQDAERVESFYKIDEWISENNEAI